ncbi:MAG: hypothetical protein K6B44_12355 [Lachnospiraceae bacterium]|nr:hypothetical protein [Lachnospiraceae bacterium]
MKRIILLLLMAAILAALYFGIVKKNSGSDTGAADPTAADYEKIEAVKSAISEVASSSLVTKIAEDQGQWYIFDVGVIYEKDGEFYKKLAEKLGADFDPKLSNGDRLFMGVLPFRKSWRVYAGNPSNEDNMLYPDWNYSGLEKP